MAFALHNSVEPLNQGEAEKWLSDREQESVQPGKPGRIRDKGLELSCVCVCVGG